jgi:hypothetical protein
MPMVLSESQQNSMTVYFVFLSHPYGRRHGRYRRQGDTPYLRRPDLVGVDDSDKESRVRPLAVNKERFGENVSCHLIGVTMLQYACVATHNLVDESKINPICVRPIWRIVGLRPEDIT